MKEPHSLIGAKRVKVEIGVYQANCWPENWVYFPAPWGLSKLEIRGGMRQKSGTWLYRL